ncbi:uncharacterized protein [Anabrus simplex]|uniref:uncharacterized protein n=1 Tax=Anabrus simplex TaxID=316456 RepID=UPI0035A3C72B
MDLKVKIKEEPDWTEGTASTSLGNFELHPTMTYLKEETKPVLTEPGPTQPAADIKDEIIIEEHTTEQFVPHIVEENHVENVAVLTMQTIGDGLFHCIICNSPFRMRSELQQHMLLDSEERPNHCKKCSSSLTQRSNHRNNGFLVFVVKLIRLHGAQALIYLKYWIKEAEIQDNDVYVIKG